MQAILPDGITVLAALFLILASFFTSFLTAAVGIGGGLLMLALMAYFLPPLALIPVHGVIQLGSNFSRVLIQRDFIDWQVSSAFSAGSLMGVVIGAYFIIQLEPSILKLLLACFILVMAWIRLPSIKTTGKPMVAMGGVVTTFITMFAGATGPLVAVFLKEMYQDRRQLVATHAAAMTAQHGFKVLAFGFAGFVFSDWLLLVIAMLVTGFLGTRAGTLVLNRLPEQAFRTLFKVSLTLVALDLLRRSIF